MEETETSVYGRYWRDYGGRAALLGSPYLWFSFIFTLACWNLWAKGEWWELALMVLPSIIGFSVAGFALLLSFGSEKFQRLMASAPIGDTNAFLDLFAAFTHFVIVQFFGFAVALLAKAFYVPAPNWWPEFPPIVGDAVRTIFWGSGFFVFSYSMACGLAATMRIYRVAEVFSKLRKQEAEDEGCE